MALVFDRHDEVAKYVSDRIGRGLFPPFTALGYENSAGQMTAGIVFNCWTGHDIDLTIANDGGLHRQLIWATAKYVLDQLGCSRGTIIVKKSDQKTYETALKFGFKVEGIKRFGFGDEDAVIMGMTREDCRWLRSN